MVGFLNAFSNQFFGDIFVILRTHGRSFLSGRHEWHLPIATRFLPRRTLLRSRCGSKFFLRAGPVEIIWLGTTVAARDLARPLLDHLRRDRSESFRSTNDFSALL